jgi:CheY-like chemotaxis protein
MKILLIEDDKFFQKFYLTKLAENKVEVIIAVDGEDGLIKMMETKPDLVLLDLIMPKVDGFAVLTARSQNEILMRIPVIVFSTLNQEKDIERARILGANGYINKGSFDFNNMVHIVNEVMKSS